jgi:accessory colonization factor AcfC
MTREVYGKNGDRVVVMDVRDLLHGEYAVDVLVADGAGYQTVYSSSSLEKCIARAKRLEATA